MSSTPSVPPVSRNDPCPCGSGRKYKHCCGQAGGAPAGGKAAPGGTRAITPARILIGVVVLVVATFAFVRWMENRGKPQPWEYNAELDQHFDPNHGHWHKGPPPKLDERGVPVETPVKAPDPLVPASR